jgi:hypothetical protein
MFASHYFLYHLLWFCARLCKSAEDSANQQDLSRMKEGNMEEESYRQDIGTISRRDLLKMGGATLALGAVSAEVLIGCTPSGSEVNEGDSTDAAGPPAQGEATANRWQSQAAADWQKAPNSVDEASIKDGGTFDIVIIGGGCAGTFAARSATKNGAKVCVLEAVPEDEFMYFGGEVACINSEWALAHGATPVDKTEWLNCWLQRFSSRINQQRARDFFDHSGRIMDESIAEINEVDPDFYQNTDRTNIYSAEADDRMVMDPSGYRWWRSTIIHRPVSADAFGWEWGKLVLTTHRNNAIAAGTEWYFGHHAEYLEKDATGRVVSVIAKNAEDDSYTRFTGTRGIVLTAGDFANDIDMVCDILDEYRHLAEAHGDIDLIQTVGGFGLRDGSGIKLGVWAGGHVEAGPRSSAGSSGPAAPWGFGFMLLNQKGRRFCNECVDSIGFMCARQPDGVILSFADANYLETVYRMPPASEAVNLTAKVTFNGLDPLNANMAACDPNSSEPYAAVVIAGETDIYCANTFSELLDKLGCYNETQKANALEELEKWNTYAEQGEDPDFGLDARIMQSLKTPPFYAVMGRAEALGGSFMHPVGLDTDENSCVLDSHLNPIPGLYAAGNVSGNRFAVTYLTPLAGLSIGYAMTEGTLVGERLATNSPEQLEIV